MPCANFGKAGTECAFNFLSLCFDSEFDGVIGKASVAFIDDSTLMGTVRHGKVD